VATDEPPATAPLVYLEGADEVIDLRQDVLGGTGPRPLASPARQADPPVRPAVDRPGARPPSPSWKPWAGAVGFVALVVLGYVLATAQPSMTIDAPPPTSATETTTPPASDGVDASGVPGRPTPNLVEPDVEPFVDPAGHFRVSMLPTPTSRTSVIPTAAGNVSRLQWISGDSQLEQSVSVIERANLDLPAAAHQAALDHSTQLGGTLLNEKLGQDLAGHTVYDYEVLTDSEYVLDRLVFTPDRYFVLQTRSPSGPADPAQEDLVTSFTVTEAPKS
jgi:hypothetical protein